MPNVLLEDTIAMERQAQEIWPQKIFMYQPYIVEQILLLDSANCLAVEAFLKMCDLKVETVLRSNAEYMSPSGKIPFIRCGSSVIPELDNIVTFVANKGRSLSGNADEIQKQDTRAFMSLVNCVFGNAELYICWIDSKTLEEVTTKRYGSEYPWPLNHFLNWQKRREVIKRLKALGWYNKTLDNVCQEVHKCCSALSAKLGDKDYFSGERPIEIDAVIYGHIHTLTNSYFPSAIRRIQDVIYQYPKIMAHHDKIHSLTEANIFSSVSDFEILELHSDDSGWNSFDFF